MPARRRIDLTTALPKSAFAIVLIAGCAHAGSVAWPFYVGLVHGQSVWWLQMLAMMALAWQLRRCSSARQGAWLGWLFATAMQCATWWWLFISLHTYGGLASALAVLAIVGLAGFLALYHAAVCAAFVRLAAVHTAGPTLGHATSRPVVFAALWLLAELGRVAFFTGFPWGEGGYAHLDGPLTDLAKLVGVHGLTFASAWAAAAVAGLALKPHWRGAFTVAAVLALTSVVSFALRADKGESLFTSAYPATGPGVATKPFTVALLQGNIAQDEKFSGGSGIPDALNWYGEQLRRSTAWLVVTPETALPLLPEQLPEGYLADLLNHFMQPEPGALPTAALIGIPLGNSQEGYTNSVIGLKPANVNAVKTAATAGESVSDAGSKAYRYDKHHLVPFGEFVHPLFKWFLDIVNMPLSDFNRGGVSQPSFNWQGQRIAPNICYEDLFGEELAARFIDPLARPTLFVNISNIGWFGNTIAIDQHLNISRMRAIEFERPMIRATNTGATAIIDHRGVVTHSLERHTRGVLVGQVEGRDGITPYAWWVSRFGLWPLWMLCLAIVSSVIICRRKTAGAPLVA